MSVKTKFTKKQITTAKALLIAATTVAEIRDAQAILLQEVHGMSHDQAATAMGLTHAAYDALLQALRQTRNKP